MRELGESFLRMMAVVIVCWSSKSRICRSRSYRSNEWISRYSMHTSGVLVKEEVAVDR